MEESKENKTNPLSEEETTALDSMIDMAEKTAMSRYGHKLPFPIVLFQYISYLQSAAMKELSRQGMI